MPARAAGSTQRSIYCAMMEKMLKPAAWRLMKSNQAVMPRVPFLKQPCIQSCMNIVAGLM